MNLNMVQNSKKYSRVRETLKDFNQGKASKNAIMDALAATGYAENPKWASNVKDILNKRIAGKNKDELLNLYNSLSIIYLDLYIFYASCVCLFQTHC